MSSYGITPVFADLVFGTWNNATLTIPIVCGQLHTGPPGAAGLASVSAITARSQITFAAPSAGVITITGGNPVFVQTAVEEDITGMSLWSGFDGDSSAICMFTGLLTPMIPSVQGDILNLTGLTLTWTGLAA